MLFRLVADLDFWGLLVSIVGFILAIWIWRRQDKQAIDSHEQTKILIAQARELKSIGESAKETAEKLGTEGSVRAAAARLFSLARDPKHVFNCHYPAKYDGNNSPLPSILSGDYYALHILQSLLDEHLQLRPAWDAKHVSDIDGQLGAIFLCSPQANVALASVAPALSYPSSQPPMFRGKPIPCWFISEETPELVRRGWTDKPTKRIRKGLTVWRGEQFIDSPAEKAYREAEQGRKADDVVVDYGVVLRFTEAGRTSVVIAGIHQYGTWIAGYFMDRLVRDKDYHSEIPRGEDFLAVVWGRFNSGTLQVEDGGVARRLWWIRKGRTGKIEDWLLAGKASTQSEDTVFPEATLAADGATTA